MNYQVFSLFTRALLSLSVQITFSEFGSEPFIQYRVVHCFLFHCPCLGYRLFFCYFFPRILSIYFQAQHLNTHLLYLVNNDKFLSHKPSQELSSVSQSHRLQTSWSVRFVSGRTLFSSVEEIGRE